MDRYEKSVIRLMDRQITKKFSKKKFYKVMFCFALVHFGSLWSDFGTILSNFCLTFHNARQLRVALNQTIFFPILIVT